MHPIQTMMSTRTESAVAIQPARATSLSRAAIRQSRAALAVLAIGLAAAFAVLSAPAQDTFSASTVPARTWAVDCANNELAVLQVSSGYLRYRTHDVNEKGDRVRDQIETPDGNVARLILRDGKPPTSEQDAGEKERLKALLDSPSAFAHHIHEERSNRKMGVDLLKLMPDAMLWSYAPNQPQPTGQPATGVPLVVLDFKPNPKWSPPTVEADVLTGLEGRVWIDPRTHRMVRLQSDIVHAINVGWGMLGHFYPGGSVAITQSNPAGDRWIVNHLVYQFSARALMVKSFKEQSAFDALDFQPVPAMTYQQAIKMLLDTPLPTQ